VNIRKHIDIFEEKKEDIVLEKLPYGVDDLDPVLSGDNVDYHYHVLSKGYLDRYNSGEGDPAFNLGGVKFHNMWWAQLQAPDGLNNPVGNINEFIKKNYSSMGGLIEEMTAKAKTIQGSGWVYLAKSGDIKTTPNLSFKTDIILPIDMWEHSWTDYIPSKNAKKDYIRSVMKIINWEIINDRLNNKRM
jgi:Fe-Mn family superoxide dismutase